MRKLWKPSRRAFVNPQCPDWFRFSNCCKVRRQNTSTGQGARGQHRDGLGRSIGLCRELLIYKKRLINALIECIIDVR